MADTVMAAPPQQANRTKNSVMATTLIGTHSLEHMYGHGFQVLLPAIYQAFGLVPIEAGLCWVRCVSFPAA